MIVFMFFSFFFLTYSRFVFYGIIDTLKLIIIIYVCYYNIAYSNFVIFYEYRQFYAYSKMDTSLRTM